MSWPWIRSTWMMVMFWNCGLRLKVLAGSTSALAYYAAYANAQAEKVKYSVPVPVTHEITVKIKATAGDDYPWELIAL